MVEKLAPGDLPETLYEFAMMPKYLEQIRALAALAEPEDWNFQPPGGAKELPVLQSYLRYTYSRLAEEKKLQVTPDVQHACFNTGLVTSNQEEIFTLFEVNKLTDKQSFWHFWRFCRKGEQT